MKFKKEEGDGTNALRRCSFEEMKKAFEPSR
jgi:hypothetical protein